MQKITIFTPTFNRAHLLPRLYESIAKQRLSNEICWLVIDDYSSDNTDEVINKFINDGKIFIRYLKNEENIGKMRTFNKAIKLVETPWFECVDSDDFLCDSYSCFIEKLSINDDYAGYISKMRFINKNSEKNFLPSVISCTVSELYEKYCYKYDAQMTFNSTILKKYRFPTFGDEKFLTESVFYSQIDKEYTFILNNEFTVFAEYQNDGYTAHSANIIRMYPVGWATYNLINARKHSSIKLYFTSFSLYWLGSSEAKKDFISFNRLTFKENILRFVVIPIAILRKIKYIFNRG